MSNEKLYCIYQENEENFKGAWDRLDEILTEARGEMSHETFCKLEENIKGLMLQQEKECFLAGAAFGRAAG